MSAPPTLARWDELLGEYDERKRQAEALGVQEIWTPSGALLNDPVPGHAELSGEDPVTTTLPGPPEFREAGERYLYDERGLLRSSTSYSGAVDLGFEEFFQWVGDCRYSVIYEWVRTHYLEPLRVTEAWFDGDRLLSYHKTWKEARRTESYELTYEGELPSTVRWAFNPPDEPSSVTTVEYFYDDKGRIKRLVERETGETLYKRKRRPSRRR